MAENVVLCGANSYVEKYYFNEEFSKLPEQVKEAVSIPCIGNADKFLSLITI